MVEVIKEELLRHDSSAHLAQKAAYKALNVPEVTL